jgi:predicted O-methyltransferase YrrM
MFKSVIDKLLYFKYIVREPKLNTAFRIKSHLTYKERAQLYKLSKNCEIVVEIGSYIGASACCFGQSIKERNNGNIYCIDTWLNDAMSEGTQNTFDRFKKNTSRYNKFIIPIQGYSQDVINSLECKIKKIDLLFIDGDHSYKGVKSDWDNYKKLLKTGSIIVMHDFGWAEGVQKVIGEEIITHVKEFDSLPNLWWGIIK